MDKKVNIRNMAFVFEEMIAIKEEIENSMSTEYVKKYDTILGKFENLMLDINEKQGKEA